MIPVTLSRFLKLFFFLLSTIPSIASGLLKPCAARLKSTLECAPCTLKEWAKKINTLKERPVEFSSLPLKKEYQKNILTLDEFLTTLQKAASVIAQSCKADSLWLHNKSLPSVAPDIFTLNRLYTKPLDTDANFIFKPYTQRRCTKPGSVYAFFGDLHGSTHSLIRDLLKLYDLGYIDNTFKIRKENFTLIFLGDYIDRGIYGVEVMYTIARLKIANPTQVIMVRGNHEDYILAPDFRKKHTKEEEKDNAPSFIDELYRKFDISEKQELSIFRFYELLPQALYIGCCTDRHDDFMMCCHGGLELGYNPHDLLHADKAIQFELIDTLWRKKHFTTKLDKRFQDSIKLHFDLPVLCGDIQDFVPKAPFFKITPEHTAYIGFMWNDFYVDPTKSVGQRGKKFTGWVYGKELATELLSWGTSDKVTLRGIFRGHQHNNDTGGPMLNLLCCNKGLINVWKNNHIFTLVSAPDSKLEDTGEQCFTYDSFVLVKTDSVFNQWKIIHYSRDNGMPTKSVPWTRKEFFMGAQSNKLNSTCS